MLYTMKRNITLDITRTVAIVLMVIFHFIYDLKFFGFVDFNIPDGIGWQQFRWLIISLFFVCLGISLTLAYEKHFLLKKFLVRTAQIALSAALISLLSYFTIPNNWIFFGVLHFLALSSLIVVCFVRLPKLCFLIGISLLVFGSLQILPSRWPFDLFFENLPKYTNDYVAILPWLGMVFLGVPIAYAAKFRQDPLLKYYNNSAPFWQTCLIWPGQHSLSIYLLHQPIMLGLLYLIARAI